MILLDFNQAMISGIVAQKIPLTEDTIRSICFERIRYLNKTHRHTYGKMVIAADSKQYWRRTYFPFYKAKRKEIREKSPLDWNLIYNTIDSVKEDLRKSFPYPVIEIGFAEADDIISVLATMNSINERVLILSSDMDFGQLHILSNVHQYSLIKKKMVRLDNPTYFLKEKIIRGDAGDGIPNIMSPDNIFLQTNARQGTIPTKKLNKWLTQDIDEFCTVGDMKRNWLRNETLIDFRCIPMGIVKSIIDHYNDYDDKPMPNRESILNYFISKGMINFIDSIQDY